MATSIGSIPGVPKPSTDSEPPYVRLPDPLTLFERRAHRFSVVAVGSEIGDYLAFLGALASAQSRVAMATAAPVLPAEAVARAIAHGMPPLSRDLADTSGALEVLAALLGELAEAQLEGGPAGIVAALLATDDTERRRMLRAIADGVFEIEKLGEGALVAAALQVWYALHAARLDAASLRNIGENICPCCGGAPTSSTVVGWQEAQGNRYLTCAVCCAMWNHVRVKCTACGATKGISYRSVEGSTGDIAAEVCESCRGYAKHLIHTKNAMLDPVADDVASYGLDMMLREDGWHRTGLNPFLILS
jgi:FdhE protein